MSSPSRLENAQGLSAEFRSFTVEAGVFSYFKLILGALGHSSPATDALLAAIDSFKALPGVRVAFFSPHSNSEPLAAAWLLTQSPALVYKRLTPVQRVHARMRFGFTSYATREEQLAAKGLPALPELSPEEERSLDRKNALSFRAPFCYTDKPARVGLFTSERQQEAQRIHLALAKLRPLYDAAAAEWKAAKIPTPRSNPFAKAVETFEAGRWTLNETSNGLLSGCFWVATREAPEGIEFLSPNGSRMREIGKAKVFGSEADARAWGASNGAQALLKLNWAPDSFITLSGEQPTLNALFAAKEAIELDQSTQGAPTPEEPHPEPAARPAKRAGRAL